MEFAVIQTGGKQYKVSKGETIKIEKFKGDFKVGDKIVFDNDYLDLSIKYGDEINGLGGEYKVEFKDLKIRVGFISPC